MKEQIRYRDLSWVLKIAATILLIDAAYYAYWFAVGFVAGA